MDEDCHHAMKPGFLDFVDEKLEKQIPHEIEAYEVIREKPALLSAVPTIVLFPPAGCYKQRPTAVLKQPPTSHEALHMGCRGQVIFPQEISSRRGYPV